MKHTGLTLVYLYDFFIFFTLSFSPSLPPCVSGAALSQQLQLQVQASGQQGGAIISSSSDSTPTSDISHTTVSSNGKHHKAIATQPSQLSLSSLERVFVFGYPLKAIDSGHSQRKYTNVSVDASSCAYSQRIFWFAFRQLH